MVQKYLKFNRLYHSVSSSRLGLFCLIIKMKEFSRFQASNCVGLLLRPLEVIVVQNGWIHSQGIDEETLNNFIPVARIHNYSVHMTVIHS